MEAWRATVITIVRTTRACYRFWFYSVIIPKQSLRHFCKPYFQFRSFDCQICLRYAQITIQILSTFTKFRLCKSYFQFRSFECQIVLRYAQISVQILSLYYHTQENVSISACFSFRLYYQKWGLSVQKKHPLLGLQRQPNLR